MRKQQNQAHTPSKNNHLLEHGTLLVLFNKPYEVLCQFSAEGDKRTLAEFIKIPSVYAAGRLDFDSEGLLILTNNGKLQQAISHPKYKLAKTYWVQVEGDISEEALHQLRAGVSLNDGPTLPALARRIEAPNIWERHPPIRVRQTIPTSWVELVIKEGRNRQVRRMTAAVGFPTLRLVRAAIGEWQVNDLAPGELRVLGMEALPGPLRKLIGTAPDMPVPKPKTTPRDRNPRGKHPGKPTEATSPSGNAHDDQSRAHPPKPRHRASTPSSKKGPRS